MGSLCYGYGYRYGFSAMLFWLLNNVARACACYRFNQSNDFIVVAAHTFRLNIINLGLVIYDPYNM